jgi:hypothetical protein
MMEAVPDLALPQAIEMFDDGLKGLPARRSP